MGNGDIGESIVTIREVGVVVRKNPRAVGLVTVQSGLVSRGCTSAISSGSYRSHNEVMTISNRIASGSLTGKKVQRVTSTGANAGSTLKALIEGHVVYWEVKTQPECAAKDMVWHCESRSFRVRNSGEPCGCAKRL